MTRILVTGAGGFIGSNVTKVLRRRKGRVVYCLDRDPSSPLQADLLKPHQVIHAVGQAKPDVVVHLAGPLPQAGDDPPLWASARKMTYNLLASLYHCKLLIFMSSCMVYGRSPLPFRESSSPMPTTAYGRSKRECELLCERWAKLHEVPLIILRPSVVYGKGQSNDMLIPSIERAVREAKLCNVHHPVYTRDFVHVRDVARAVDMVIRNPQNGVVNVASGYEVSVRCLIQEIVKICPRASHHIVETKNSDVERYAVDIEKAYSLYGWAPKVSLNEGLREIFLPLR